MRSIKNGQIKPIATISLLFSYLEPLGGPISRKNKRIEVPYAQH